jgi:hypothetical protein
LKYTTVVNITKKIIGTINKAKTNLTQNFLPKRFFETTLIGATFSIIGIKLISNYIQFLFDEHWFEKYCQSNKKGHSFE